MDIYVGSIAINSPDPRERMVFSMMLNYFADDLNDNEVSYIIPILKEPKDHEMFKSYDDIPENHILNLWIEYLEDTGNFAPWMHDANCIAIGYAGFFQTEETPF